MVLKRSSSVGRVPVGVERHLKVAIVKSRGFGSSQTAFSPLPSPSCRDSQRNSGDSGLRGRGLAFPVKFSMGLTTPAASDHLVPEQVVNCA